MHKVIYDTDPGVDDAMALLFLHHHPDIDLLGITTVFGNASIETTTRNALFLKREWEIPCPVARGAGVCYDPGRSPDAPPAWIHGQDGLGNIGVPDVSEMIVDPRSAHQFIIDTVRAHPGEVTLVAVGRMTNLANALKADPAIVGLVKSVVIMGGAFDAYGNVSPAAEANIFGDPAAADVIFTADWDVVAVPLDVTSKTIMTRAFLAEMASMGGPRVELLAKISQFYIDFYEQIVDDGMMLHDSCACVYVVAPELFKTRSGAVRVACGSVADGQTIQKPDGMHFGKSDWDVHKSQLVTVECDDQAILKLVRDVILRRS